MIRHFTTMGIVHFKILDIAKFIACLLVVSRHCHPFGVGNAFDVINNWITAIAVPFFFASSSFLFWYKKGKIKRYVLRLLQLYLVWFVIELPLVIERFSPFEITRFLSDLFFHNTFYASWYLMASVLGMVFVYFLSKLFNNIVLVIFGLSAFFVAMIFSTYHGFFIDSPIGNAVDSLGNYIYFSNSVFSAFIYIVIGKIIADNFNSISNRNAFLIVFPLLLSFVFYFAEYVIVRLMGEAVRSYASCLSIIPFTYCFVILCLWLDGKVVMLRNEKFFDVNLALFFRMASILIYLSHPLFLMAIAAVSPFKNDMVQFLSTIICGILFTVVVKRYSVKIKILKRLY